MAKGGDAPVEADELLIGAVIGRDRHEVGPVAPLPARGTSAAAPSATLPVIWPVLC